MRVFVINAGSSSIKFQLLDMPNGFLVCQGMAERVGSENAVLKYRSEKNNYEENCPMQTHEEGFNKIVASLLDTDRGVITTAEEIDAIGHRVVHGGDSFSDTALIARSVKEKIAAASALAPLHNPHNLNGIEITERLFPKAKQVAVFDTAFFQTMPVKARKYAIPNHFYAENGIQVYGFHGTSHKYVTEKAQEYLGTQHSKLISIHLGNGCSMTAVENGKSIDHSLGFSPGNGLIMGSRSGDIDHAVIFHLVNELGHELKKVNEMLTKESGLVGLTGFNDLRDIQAQAEQGNPDCQLALDMTAYRIRKYIGAYAAAMNGLDAIIFTAGIGENSAILRSMACADMDYFGIEMDSDKNRSPSHAIREIGKASAKVKILVIPTNEELEIARQVFKLLNA